MDGQRKAKRAARSQVADDFDLDFAMFDTPPPAPEIDRIAVLRVLEQGPADSAAAIAKRLGCSASQVHAALRRLQRGRFVFADEDGWTITGVGSAELAAADKAAAEHA